MSNVTFVFATGAGAPSTHPWMQRWAARLRSLGNVELFDYAYLAEGRKRPDTMPQLIEPHRAALHAARAKYGDPIVLIGKSMGSRVGCHLSLQEPVAALVCLGYPLCAGGDRARLRDQVLHDLRTPVLFVQGTRDPLCPLDLLEEVRSRMSARNELHVVEGGDHSLELRKMDLKAAATTQEEVESRALDAIQAFARSAISG